MFSSLETTQILSNGTTSLLGESDLMGEGFAIRIGRFLVQNPLGVRLGLGTQPCYEALGDLWVKHVQMQ